VFKQLGPVTGALMPHYLVLVAYLAGLEMAALRGSTAALSQRKSHDWAFKSPILPLARPKRAFKGLGISKTGKIWDFAAELSVNFQNREDMRQRTSGKLRR
jgi:hypothetical protein